MDEMEFTEAESNMNDLVPSTSSTRMPPLRNRSSRTRTWNRRPNRTGLSIDNRNIRKSYHNQLDFQNCENPLHPHLSRPVTLFFPLPLAGIYVRRQDCRHRSRNLQFDPLPHPSVDRASCGGT